jgi:Transglycosylase SLT domain
MEAITFCPRCRGMKEGWNRKYILHHLVCMEVVSRSVKSLIVTLMFSSLIFAFPVPTGVFSEFDTTSRPGLPAVVEATFAPTADPAISSIERLLTQHGVDVSDCTRIAGAIVGSSRKYHLDPKLVASIIIVESRANPFAISDSSSVGIMQIHLPTWGRTADRQNVNLFKVEDNVAFGVRILRGYVARFGLWAGVMRYKGWTEDGSESQQKADEYVQKVKRIYQPQSQAASIPAIASVTP